MGEVSFNSSSRDGHRKKGVRRVYQINNLGIVGLVHVSLNVSYQKCIRRSLKAFAGGAVTWDRNTRLTARPIPASIVEHSSLEPSPSRPYSMDWPSSPLAMSSVDIRFPGLPCWLPLAAGRTLRKKKVQAPAFASRRYNPWQEYSQIVNRLLLYHQVHGSRTLNHGRLRTWPGSLMKTVGAGRWNARVGSALGEIHGPLAKEDAIIM